MLIAHILKLKKFVAMSLSHRFKSELEERPGLLSTMSNQDEFNLDSNEMMADMCPDCGDFLTKCLIQQNYAMVLCPNLRCGYPFNQNETSENVVYVEESEVLEVAKQRLSKS